MSKALQTLRDTLYATGLVYPLDGTGKGGSFSLLCRQVPGQEKAWLKLAENLLKKEAEVGNMELHICRRYKLASDGQIAFGWSIGVTAANSKALEAAVEALKPVLQQAKPDLTPVPAPTVRPVVPSRTQVRKAGPQIQVVKRERDSATGQEMITYEMPLPHMTGRMNENHQNGKGAWLPKDAPLMVKRGK